MKALNIDILETKHVAAKNWLKEVQRKSLCPVGPYEGFVAGYSTGWEAANSMAAAELEVLREALRPVEAEIKKHGHGYREADWNPEAACVSDIQLLVKEARAVIAALRVEEPNE